MASRMIVNAQVHENVSTFLKINDFVAGFLPAFGQLTLPIHEFLLNGLNHFELVAASGVPFTVPTKVSVSLSLTLQQTNSKGIELGQETVMSRNQVVEVKPFQTQVSLFSIRQHLPANFPTWQCFSALQCPVDKNDLQLARQFVHQLMLAVIEKNEQYLNQVFSSRNQELAFAYGLTTHDSLGCFSAYLGHLMSIIDIENQPAANEVCHLLQIGQGPVFFPVNQEGKPWLRFLLKAKPQTNHYLPVHLAVIDQQVFVVR